MTIELREWCRANWRRLPEDKRKACVDHLDGWIKPSDIQTMVHEDYDKDPMFHLRGGMAIRNRLRDIVRDEDLPLIKLDHRGESYGSRNWDDYYTGALDELLDRYRPKSD